MTTEQSSAPSSPQQPGPLGKMLAFIVAAAMLVLGFMFSLVALAVVAVGGLMVWGWLWWKTRAIRQQIREQGLAQGPMTNDFSDGQIIEGEVIREHEPASRPERLLR